jgi:hypothetical protein
MAILMSVLRSAFAHCEDTLRQSLTILVETFSALSSEKALICSASHHNVSSTQVMASATPRRNNSPGRCDKTISNSIESNVVKRPALVRILSKRAFADIHRTSCN